MTVFAAPDQVLPNNGGLRRPDLDAAGHCYVLAGLAAQAYDAENAPLRAAAQQILAARPPARPATMPPSSASAPPVTPHPPRGHRLERPPCHPHRPRPGPGPWATLCVLPVLVYAEGTLLSQSAMVSGVFSLVPGVLRDQVFARAFAAFPLAGGLLIRSHIANFPAAQGSARAASALATWAKRLLYIWIGLFALVFNPTSSAAAAAPSCPGWGHPPRTRGPRN